MKPYLIISFPIAIYDGPGIETSSHRHSILQICGSRKDVFPLKDQNTDQEFSLALVPPGVLHKTYSGTDTFMVYMDTFALGLRFTKSGKRILELGAAMNREKLIELITAAREEGIYHLTNFLLERLSPYLVPVDDRLRNLDKTLNDPDDESALKRLSLSSGISESRLRHLFSEDAGIPIRRYRLWRRLLHAVRLAANGKSLTDAALEAGFADSAHFTRTFRTMLGVTPKSLFVNPEIDIRIHE